MIYIIYIFLKAYYEKVEILVNLFIEKFQRK